MSNYSLQKYSGYSSRHTCPKCGDKHSFTFYVDENNNHLHASVGRCNHESSCGYHYSPKQYFQEHPKSSNNNDFSFNRPKNTLQSSVTKTISYIPIHYVEQSQSVKSNFFHFISSLIRAYCGYRANNVLKRLLEEYHLGATRDGSVIFWQIDCSNKVRTGKVMQYDPNDGHRIKSEQGAKINWIHSILKKKGVISSNWQLSQCLFGEHLLSSYPNKVVVIVEAEKSAIIGSAIFPDYVWLATGGKSQMKEEKLRVLEGKTVILFPDSDAYDDWKKYSNKLTNCKVILSNILEQHATPIEKASHIDIADWIIQQIRNGYTLESKNHIAEAETILQQMIKKNQVITNLIDDFNLELIGKETIIKQAST